jgi:ABC-type thiamine transport system substrate-binding protein
MKSEGLLRFSSIPVKMTTYVPYSHSRSAGPSCVAETVSLEQGFESAETVRLDYVLNTIVSEVFERHAARKRDIPVDMIEGDLGLDLLHLAKPDCMEGST